jgi:predicted DCC family thiol-disulfide oxidoreductase YuxK
MQSEAGAALYRRFGIDPADPETLILVAGDRALRDSDAVLAIWRGLGWPWRAAVLARIVPAALRDPLYRWVARNRYRLFGRREACWLPDPELADRFL